MPLNRSEEVAIGRQGFKFGVACGSFLGSTTGPLCLTAIVTGSHSIPISPSARIRVKCVVASAAGASGIHQ